MADRLTSAGYDAVHVGRIGLRGATDAEVLAKAAAERRVVVSADTDFGDLLRADRRSAPSVVLLRGPAAPRRRLEVLVAILDTYAAELLDGAIVVIRRSGHVGVRPLPLT
jgi:predicted nuclease of predicted toxin-antitoxin system